MRNSNLSSELGYQDNSGNHNLPIHEEKFREIEEKRLSLLPNPPTTCRKVFHSKVHVIPHLSAKFEPIKKWYFYIMNFSKVEGLFQFYDFSSLFNSILPAASDKVVNSNVVNMEKLKNL